MVMKMEKIIQELPKTDETTKVILNELVEKKDKLDKAEKYYRYHVLFSFGLSIILLYSIYQAIGQFDVIHFGTLQMLITQNNLNLFLVILLILDFAWLKVAKGKCTKLETEFHQLRMEIVDKAKDLWKSDEAWSGRHHVFSVIKEKFDINLYYESK
ncbi:MAG: hypothetical protein K0R71_282 [Bacillales bacterium]|jgi:hypothetical protein|nr:hypothetical protein [Bacillales bacterium]